MSPWEPPEYGYTSPQPAAAPPQLPPGRHGRRRTRKLLSALVTVIAAVIIVAIIRAVTVANSSGQPGYSTPGGTAIPSAAAAAPARAAGACASHHAVTGRQWLLIVKDPDAHKGECIIVYGEISQFDSATGDAAFRADAGGAKVAVQYGFADYPTNTVFDGSPSVLQNFVEGDLFAARVTVEGHTSYDNTLGGQTSVPLMQVDSITRIGHLST